jgi:hypothetical protein
MYYSLAMKISYVAGERSYFAFGVQQLHAAPRSGMCDGVVLVFVIVA